MQNLTQNTGDPERRGEDSEGMFLDCMGNRSTLKKTNKKAELLRQGRFISFSGMRCKSSKYRKYCLVQMYLQVYLEKCSS